MDGEYEQEQREHESVQEPHQIGRSILQTSPSERIEETVYNGLNRKSPDITRIAVFIRLHSGSFEVGVAVVSAGIEVIAGAF